MDTCPPGRQVEITYNDQRAIVDEVGGGIRCYEVGGRSVFGPYPIDPMCDGAHGAPLIPSPNRLADGQYCFDDERQLPTGTGPVDGTAYDSRESSHASSGRRHWTSPSPTSSGTHTAGTGPASGGQINERSRSGRRRATGTWSSTPATLAAFGHHPKRATQVGAVTVTAGGSYITTRDLTGFGVKPQDIARAQHIWWSVGRARLLGKLHRLISWSLQW